ncbi:VanW family protein [Arthrobacter halodurans]|uniref:VanW family protein n=1 Tax=Arthrobacter halodurans TaxID=516699 RepID=A0ABV4UKP5_9MICC
MKVRDTKRGRLRTAWLVGGASAVVLAGAYAGGAWFLGGQVPAGTKVHGVDIGGMDAAQAADALHAELGPVAGRGVRVAAAGRDATLDPAASGLALDVDATLEDQTGYTLDPSVLWHRLSGGGPLEPVLTADEDRLRGALEAASARLDRVPVEGAIAFRDARPSVAEPVAGSVVDIDAAVPLVAAAWFDAPRPIDLPAETIEPAVEAKAFDRARTDLAEPLVAGPVTVTAGGLKASLGPEVLADAAAFAVADDRVSMTLDNEALADALLEANPDLASTARDARIELRNGRPAVLPSVPGRGVDTAGLADKILKAASTPRRTAAVKLSVTQPELTTAGAKALGVKEQLVEFSTPYPTYDALRTKNLRAGAAKLNGVLVMPGETFSLIEHLAPITAANGYFDSGVVVDGFESKALGGGLSQISTQLFNAGFLAGMDDVEHQPHSRWFDRYPAGREATLWEGVIDMKWRNNTGHAVMIQTWVADRVYTRLWGTDVWDVATSTSDHFDVRKPRTVYNAGEKCVPESGGQEGFSVTVTRDRKSATRTLPRETLRWTYQPWNKVVCGEKP